MALYWCRSKQVRAGLDRSVSIGAGWPRCRGVFARNAVLILDFPSPKYKKFIIITIMNLFRHCKFSFTMETRTFQRVMLAMPLNPKQALFRNSVKLWSSLRTWECLNNLFTPQFLGPQWVSGLTACRKRLRIEFDGILSNKVTKCTR